MRSIAVVFAFLLASTLSCAGDNTGMDEISLPPGFSIEVYADVPKARSLAMGENGTVFVSNRRADSIYALVPTDGGELEVLEIISGLDSPNGIAVHAGDLYVAETSRILRFPDVESRLHDMLDAEILDVSLPTEGHHGWRYMGFGPDGKLYVSIGVPCNICDREGFGRIVRMNADGSDMQTYVSGVRNSVGLTWHPDNGELWFTDNGRDMLGDDLPADELNHASGPGVHFGYPYCHAGEILDPEFGAGRSCSDYAAPAQKLGPHVAALGVKFYTGTTFPAEYHGQIFIAEHGSWNRSKKIGYRVSLVRLQNGVPVGYEVFAQGWLQGQSVSGRPVDLLVLADGSLLVSDDHAGKIYRIYYEE